MTHREELWNKAYKKIFELYGETQAIQIVDRLLSEKRSLADYGVAEYFDELAGICDGYDLPYETYIPYAQNLKNKDSVPRYLIIFLKH